MKISLRKTRVVAAIALSFSFVLGERGLSQEMSGIGVALQAEEGRFVVKQVLAGGPAAASGQIKPGDRIVAIAQDDKPAVPTEGLPIAKAVQMLRGPKGTVVQLTIATGEGEEAAQRIVTLVRGELKLLRPAPAAAVAFEPGKAAPEIEGEDVEGKRFKLSDYRGKVVLLDFWGDW